MTEFNRSAGVIQDFREHVKRRAFSGMILLVSESKIGPFHAVGHCEL